MAQVPHVVTVRIDDDQIAQIKAMFDEVREAQAELAARLDALPKAINATAASAKRETR